MSKTRDKLTNPVWVNVVSLDDELIPEYQTPGSAACDLKSTDEFILPSGSRTVVGTGIKLEIPKGFAAMVCSRSGLAAKNGIQVLNAPGIIDTDYRGEIKVILHNTSGEEFIIKKGDRVAQLLFFPIFQAVFHKVDEVTSTQRGEGGLGSTGV